MTAFLKSNSSYYLKAFIQDTTAKVIIVLGEQETTIMKKSADLLHQYLPGSQLQILPGYHHGDLSINHPAEYAKLLQSLS